MKKILIVMALLLPPAAWAQASNPDIIPSPIAPSGACAGALPLQVVTPAGTLYACQNGVWTVISGGAGGSGTVQSGSGYALPAYGSGASTAVGPSQITADATGKNLTVPGAVNVSSPGALTTTLTAGHGAWHRRGVVNYGMPYALNPATNVLEQTVIVTTSGHYLAGSPVFRMWYTNTTAGNGNNTYYAESQDGIQWTQEGEVIAGHECNSVILIGSTWYYFGLNTSTLNIDEFTSSDGVTWTLAYLNVLGGTSLTGVSNSGEHLCVSGETGCTVGTLYLYADANQGMGLWTSTDYHTFTYQGIMVPTTGDCAWAGGPTNVFFISGTWYMWGFNGFSACSLAQGSAIGRLSATALAGPWTVGPMSISAVTADEGIGNGIGAQVADPYIVPVSTGSGQKVFLYYTGSARYNSGTGKWLMVGKLAVADMPLAQLVLTSEGDSGDSLDNDGMLGMEYDYATNGVSTSSHNLEPADGYGIVWPGNGNDSVSASGNNLQIDASANSGAVYISGDYTGGGNIIAGFRPSPVSSTVASVDISGAFSGHSIAVADAAGGQLASFTGPNAYINVVQSGGAQAYVQSLGSYGRFGTSTGSTSPNVLAYNNTAVLTFGPYGLGFPITYTVANLPSAATAGVGATVLVTDATTFTPGTCTGGGSDTMIAVSNGTTWSCH